jgi:signal peptidase II
MLMLILTIIVADQWSKSYIVQHIALWNFIKVNPFFNLIHTTNHGISFGMFSEEGIPSIFFIAIALIFCLALFIWAFKSPEKHIEKFCAMIIGGAIGNVIDRVVHGSVIDFIDLHFMGHHFPAFNVADSCICIGAALLMIAPFLEKKLAAIALKRQSS